MTPPDVSARPADQSATGQPATTQSATDQSATDPSSAAPTASSTETSPTPGASGIGRFAGVVALDGPSGTGKSTVARRLAQRLGGRYLDTGAMYRAATVAVLDAGISLADPDAIARTVAGSRIEIGTQPVAAVVKLNGVEVSRAIRSAEVTAAVSAVSAVGAVRAQLVAQQRELIGNGGIVVEGRDIASVVWPEARPKVYLTASADERARRRGGQLGSGADLSAVEADLRRRDGLDSSRAASPLRKADGATELDTTGLNIDEVVQRLVDMVTSSGADPG